MWLKSGSPLLIIIILSLSQNYVQGQKKKCDCGRTNPTENKVGGRIKGGDETGVNEYPYMVQIRIKYYVEPSKWQHQCGGGLITSQHVLTAAHCVYSYTTEMLRVVVGEHDHTISNETEYTEVLEIDTIKCHPEYHQTVVNDIAVLITKTSIAFNHGVQPVCFPKSHMFLDEEIVTVTGWGQLFYSGGLPNSLRAVGLTVVRLHECKVNYPPPILPTHLCIYAESGDTCKRDSGGPVTWFDPKTERYVLVGIVVSGHDNVTEHGHDNVTGHGHNYHGSLNTRVDAYIDWVQQVLSETTNLTGGERLETCSVDDVA